MCVCVCVCIRVPVRVFIGDGSFIYVWTVAFCLWSKRVADWLVSS